MLAHPAEMSGSAPPGTSILGRMTTATNAMTTPRIESIGFRRSQVLSRRIAIFARPQTPVCALVHRGRASEPSCPAAASQGAGHPNGRSQTDRSTRGLLCTLGNSAVQRRPRTLSTCNWYRSKPSRPPSGFRGCVSPASSGNLNSPSSWAVLAGVAVLPPIVMMWRWSNPRRTLSESIQEARR